jgi:hypothetical protein
MVGGPLLSSADSWIFPAEIAQSYYSEEIRKRDESVNPSFGRGSLEAVGGFEH